MRYSWDREKNRRNVIRHGIAFEDAVRISTGPRLRKLMTVSTVAKAESMRLAW